MLQHIGHIALLVRDYDEAISYFVAKLGFTVAEDTDLGGGKRWVLVAPPGSVEARLVLAKAVSADELARGNQTGAASSCFCTRTISGATTLSTFKPERPSEKASVELYPIWQLAALGHDSAEPSSDRGQTSRKAKNASMINPSPVGGQQPNVEPSRARSEPAANSRAKESKEAPVGDSRCNNMRDRLGCPCAVRNGDGISSNGKGWYSKRGVSAPTIEAFVQCQIRAGRS
jgi:catechol 2,3-dioxygenase-like lactoylglutathione lyase family enzyme